MREWAETLRRMGWYLDTSLFMDFIERNIRKGFDTAETHNGRTVLRVRGLSNVRKQMFVPIVRGGVRYAFELTTTVAELQSIQLSYGTRYHYSELTKAEVFRSLRKEHAQRAKREIENWWEAFACILGDYRRAELDFPIGDEFSRLALDFPIRKNVQDYLHLITAKEKGLAFMACDKLGGQAEELRTTYYTHIYYWPDVKGAILDDETRRFWNLDK